jgi:hypothetical protein
MTIAQFIRARLRKVEEDMDTHAHSLAQGGRSYEEYLIGVGRYRQLKSERDAMNNRLERMAAADDPEPGNAEPEDDDEDPTPAPPKKRRPMPRAWGGR